jgi:hypothetical protein
MNYEKYIFTVDETATTFNFISEGPKGNIKKRIQFQSTERKNLYNLAFGDVNEATDDINDIVVTNNHDSEKVLATVANAVIEFMKYYPFAGIYAEGSTTSRTRLYQMGISKNLEEIKTLFDIFGLTNDDKWGEFEKNIAYSAFYIKRKEL